MGLTSAATIWVVAGIGLLAGAGFPVLAVVAALMVLLTLVVLGKFEHDVLENVADSDHEPSRRH